MKHNRHYLNALCHFGPCYAYARDEQTVKFFSSSPILTHKNWIRSSSDPQNFWK